MQNMWRFFYQKIFKKAFEYLCQQYASPKRKKLKYCAYIEAKRILRFEANGVFCLFKQFEYSRFFFSIINDIKTCKIGRVLDLSLFFYFLIILGFRPGTSDTKGLINIKSKNNSYKKNIVNFNFKSKTSKKVKHSINISDSFIVKKLY